MENNNKKSILTTVIIVVIASMGCFSILFFTFIACGIISAIAIPQFVKYKNNSINSTQQCPFKKSP